MELCAAKVSKPILEELRVVRMPIDLSDVRDEVDPNYLIRTS